MLEQIKNSVLKDLAGTLNRQQLELVERAFHKAVNKITTENQTTSNEKVLSTFLQAKKLEGCSHKTLSYYEKTVKRCLDNIEIPYDSISTDHIRNYLCLYERENKVSKVTIDNVRRILSSFFAWLEEEDYILKSPVKRIHKVKTATVVKEVYNDEELEVLRDNCEEIRDLALLDLLISTGMRIGELVNLNIQDVNFQERECKVLGKGNKERIVYFDARTKLHLEQYIETRRDSNKALFTSLNAPFNRLTISGAELRVRKIGSVLLNTRVHPHKFRRTLATQAIDKGMPIEQLQELLGHKKIDTTLQYAMVKRNNVKLSHRKYIC